MLHAMSKMQNILSCNIHLQASRMQKYCKSARGLKRHHKAVHAIPVALLIHSKQPDLQPQHGEAGSSHSSPPALPEAEVEDYDLIMNMHTPSDSPTISSPRSPSCLPNGCPLPGNARWTSPPPIKTIM